MKTIRKVREKASDVKMVGQTIMNKRLKDLTNNRKKALRRYLPSFPSFLKTGTTDEDFQQECKQDSTKLIINKGNSREHILRTMAGILSEPVALDAS